MDERPTLIATSRAKRAGRRCDHCRRVVPVDASIYKLIQACCDNPRHFRSSRRSGGAGSWVCESCSRDLEPAFPTRRSRIDL